MSCFCTVEGNLSASHFPGVGMTLHQSIGTVKPALSTCLRPVEGSEPKTYKIPGEARRSRMVWHHPDDWADARRFIGAR